MQENIEQIIDPGNDIKSYLKMRNALKIFTVFCILQQVLMLIVYALKNGSQFTLATASATGVGASAGGISLTSAYYGNIVLNLASNLYGLRSLAYHS